eukprot:scaffold3212_cov154-Alexandrium_tamarense.AAC.3
MTRDLSSLPSPTLSSSFRASMNTKSSLAQAHNQSRTTQHFRYLLLSLALAISFNLGLGSAFIFGSCRQQIIASAMSTDGSASAAGGAKQPTSWSQLSAEETDGKNNNNGDDVSSAGGDETLLLPASNTADPSIPTIKLGETIKFEDMGPVIINSDGTTRRIDNWDNMSKHEQEVAWRRISKRNNERRAALLEEAQRREMEEKEKES